MTTSIYEYDAMTAYLQDMRGCRQFRVIGVEPVWCPGTKDIEGFVRDEVVRQFHDPRVRADGGLRIEWMMNAWTWAQRMSKEQSTPTIQDVINLGMLVEPQLNGQGFRTSYLAINDRPVGVEPRYIYSRMEMLWATIEYVAPLVGKTSLDENSKEPTADDFYLEFERVHPFRDGNGRVGKIIHNWLLGSLDDPILVADYFGGIP